MRRTQVVDTAKTNLLEPEHGLSKNHTVDPMTPDIFSYTVYPLAKRCSREALRVWLVLLLEELKACIELQPATITHAANAAAATLDNRRPFQYEYLVTQLMLLAG